MSKTVVSKGPCGPATVAVRHRTPAGVILRRSAARLRGRDTGSRAWTIAAAACLAAGFGTTLVTVATVYRLHVPLPYWDEWYTIFDFRKFAAGGYGLTDLAGQHNEHRLLFPRLFFFADELLFGLSGMLDETVTVLLQLVDAAVLIVLMLRLVAAPAHRALLAGFVLLMLFTLRQEQNFSNGFQLQFVGVFTAAALAGVAYAVALDRLRRGGRRSAPFFALAALCCVVSAYTMANGVLAGVVLAAVAVLRRAPWPVPVATAVLSAALAALFFHDYLPGGSSYGGTEALAHAWAYPRFVTAYLGNPLGSGLRITQALGVVGLLLAAGAAWRVATDRAREPASVALLALVAFVIATAVATAYGRVASGTPQAFESRYATPSLLFWTALVVFWFPLAFGRTGGRIPAALLGGLMLLLGAAAITFEVTAWPPLAERATALRRVSDSLISGLYDADVAATYENTPPEDVGPLVPFLREHRLAAFADPDAAALGHPLGVLGRVAAPGACTGTVTARSDPALGPGGVRLSGTARDTGTGRAPRRIVVAEASGRVAGFGSASLPGRPSRLWSGYAAAPATGVLHAYARLADGALCDLGGADVAAPGS